MFGIDRDPTANVGVLDGSFTIWGEDTVFSLSLDLFRVRAAIRMVR